MTATPWRWSPATTPSRLNRFEATATGAATGSRLLTPNVLATHVASTANTPWLTAGATIADVEVWDKVKPQCVTLASATAHTAKVDKTTVFMGVLIRMGRLSLNSAPDTLIENFTMQPSLPAFVRPSKLRHTLQRGFTLIELMVVLVIIGVLAALIVPNVLDRADDARATAARTDVTNLTQALKLYKLDNMRYPTAEQGLQALIAKPTAAPAPSNWKPYLDKLPNDPWGRPYQYLNPGVKGEIDVMSFGADGQAGGDGKNADIGSWQ